MKKSKIIYVILIASLFSCSDKNQQSEDSLIVKPSKANLGEIYTEGIGNFSPSMFFKDSITTIIIDYDENGFETLSEVFIERTTFIGGIKSLMHYSGFREAVINFIKSNSARKDTFEENMYDISYLH